MLAHVKTLDRSGFPLVCRQLEEAVTASGFRPDAVLSIATGGVFVGELMFEGIPHLQTRLQRPSTKAKGGFVKQLVKQLPRCIQNWLRIAESAFLGIIPHPETAPANVALPDLSHYRRILIVDDAVDSGATLKAVCLAVASRHETAEIKTAAVTQTTLNPLIKPDFTVFNNKTLIRFPWSMDN